LEKLVANGIEDLNPAENIRPLLDHRRRVQQLGGREKSDRVPRWRFGQKEKHGVKDTPVEVEAAAGGKNG
jgi:hypothetical protein